MKEKMEKVDKKTIHGGKVTDKKTRKVKNNAKDTNKEEETPRKKKVHRAASARWHQKWLSKGVPRPDPSASAQKSPKEEAKKTSNQKKALNPQKETRRPTKKPAAQKTKTGKRDLRTVKFEYIRNYLDSYTSEEPETRKQRLSKATKAWMESDTRAKLMCKPGKVALSS